MKEGDVYNPEKVRETVQRLFQLGLYESVAFRRLDNKSTDPVQDMILLVKETSAKTGKSVLTAPEAGIAGADAPVRLTNGGVADGLAATISEFT